MNYVNCQLQRQQWCFGAIFPVPLAIPVEKDYNKILELLAQQIPGFFAIERK
ncbi:MAG: hypothetical protein PUC32_01075 [Oscillospiraceae bacterium]|nr:hypothetical protein [Oscillospiraceae bacterium]